MESNRGNQRDFILDNHLIRKCSQLQKLALGVLELE